MIQEKNQAYAIHQVLQDWYVTERIAFMPFDNTASNTGLTNGACSLLEQKLSQELISLGCRHHIHELIVARVFDSVMGCSSGPDIQLLKRFMVAWTVIDKTTYQSGMIEEAVKSELEVVKDDLVLFLQNQLATFQPRDDYKELLVLCLLFLGVEPQGEIRIIAPGDYHRAR